MATADVNGRTIAYDDVGAGDDVLVLVHGAPFNRSMWQPQHEAVRAAGWRVICPDLRGYGESTVVPGRTTLDLFVGDIIALLDQLGIGRFVIGGLSMGGQIVMECARTHAERLRGILLAATFPQADTDKGKRVRYERAEKLIREGMDGYAQDVLPQMLTPRHVTELPDVAAHVLRMMTTTAPEGAAAALRGRAERPDYAATLERLDLPALIVVGDEDAFTTRADAERMHALVKGSTLVWVPGVGHMPNLERPAEFNATLTRFLDSVRSRPIGA